MKKTAENVTMRDIATLREWASSGEGRKKYLALAIRAEKQFAWAALGAIADMVNDKKGPWAQ